jgi:wyosine [tRNA(Phe)-imidazoG37] synthetase (radical SAM superfamily)
MIQTMHFSKEKVTAIVFEREEDLVHMIKMLIALHKKGQKWPRVYALADEKTTEEELATVHKFLDEMERQKVDAKTMQMIVEKNWVNKVKKTKPSQGES